MINNYDVQYSMKNIKSNMVKEKAYQFALLIIQLYKELCDKKEFVLSKQLLRSGTSIGANVEEATAAQSKKEFISKMSVASKEARETHYWLRLLKDSDIHSGIRLTEAIDEAETLIKILTSIVKTSQANIKS